MQCSNCGKELTEEDRFCNNCGEKVIRRHEVPLTSDMPNTVANAYGEEVIPYPGEETSAYEVIPQVDPATEQVEEIAPQVSFEEEAPKVEVEEVAPQVETTPVDEPVQQSVLTPPTTGPSVDDNIMFDKPSTSEESTTTNSVLFDSTPTSTVQETTPLNSFENNAATVNDTGVASIPMDHNSLETEKIEVNKNYGPAPIVDPPAGADKYYEKFNAQVAPKKKNNLAFIIPLIVIGALFCGAIGLFIGSKIFKAVGEELGKKDAGPVAIAEYSTVTFNGSNFKIPVDYDYDVQEGKLSIFNDDLYYYVQVAPSSYSQYASNIPYLKQNYESLGYKVEKTEETAVGKTRYVILHLTTSKSEKVTLIIRAFTTSESVVCAVGKTDGSFATTKDLDNLEAILSTSETAAVKRAIDLNDLPDDDIFKGAIEFSVPDENAVPDAE